MGGGGLERITRILVRAGADRLNEAQPRRPRDELVAPHHGHAQEIELAKPRRELIQRAHLEMPDPRFAARKPFRHAIGDMGKANRKFFFPFAGMGRIRIRG
jgi:hypothetical protein